MDDKLEALRNFDDGVTPTQWAADQIDKLAARNRGLVAAHNAMVMEMGALKAERDAGDYIGKGRPQMAQPDPMADPRVTALVEAARAATEAWDLRGALDDLRIALAAFNTTDKPQGANNEVKGGKDE